MSADKQVLPMDFSDALKNMREGLAVGRAAWTDSDGVYEKTIGIKDGRIVKNSSGVFKMNKGWLPNQEDIMATDWSLVTA